MNEIIVEVGQLLDDARRNYEANGRVDYDAGVYEGLKRAYDALINLQRHYNQCKSVG